MDEQTIQLCQELTKERDKLLTLLQECKLQLEYLNQKFPSTGTTNSLLVKLKQVDHPE